MKEKEILEKIEAYQLQFKEEEKKLQSLLEVFEPGKTGFKLRKESGQVLLNPLKVEPRKIMIGKGQQFKVKEGELSLDDFMGVHPWMAIVMESESKSFQSGDLVYVNQSELQNNQPIVINGAVGILVFEHGIFGAYNDLLK